MNSNLIYRLDFYCRVTATGSNEVLFNEAEAFEANLFEEGQEWDKSHIDITNYFKRVIEVLREAF